MRSFLFVMVMSVAGICCGVEKIGNDCVRVSYDGAEEVIRLMEADGRDFARLGFEGEVAGVERIRWKDKRVGVCDALEVKLAGGERAWVVVPQNSAFVLVQMEMVNADDSTTTINRVRPFKLTYDFGYKAEDLKALGTAGLTAVDGHNGSYTFLAVAKPKSRNGVVSAWLSNDRGAGSVFSTVEQGKTVVRPQLEYGRLRLKARERTRSEIFAVGYFDDARLGLEAYADAVADFYNIELPPILEGYCTWYSNPHGGASDQTHVVELAKSAAQELKPWGFDFVQIDDRWQAGKRRNGPAKNFYTHNPEGPYPNGMKAAAQKIRAAGLIPGIWFMPFAGDREDPFFKERSDWLVKQQDGTPYWARWGGTSLDMTNPDARKYVRSVVERIADEWGYEYFKMDGLWTGTATKLTYVNNEYVHDDIGEAVFHDPNKTSIEAYRDGLRLVREAAGDNLFFLGCNVSQNMRTLGGSFGLVDAMRIGPDNGPGWSSLKRGPWHGTNRYFLHGRVWYNDPDPVYVRESMPLEHARVICSWVGLTGQLWVFSEWLDGLSDERVEVMRRTIPNHGLKPRPVDLFENELSRVWLVTDERGDVRRDVIGLFNWDENKAARFDYELSHVGFPGERYVGFDFWADRFLRPFSGRLLCTVPGGSCRVLAVRPAADRPVLVSTSRHVAQCMVDVLDEQWDEKEMVLSGESEIVPADSYELRVVVPVGEKSYRLKKVEIFRGEAKVSFEQNGPRIRVRIDGAGRDRLGWELKFVRGKVHVATPSAIEGLEATVDYKAVRLSWDSGDAGLFRVRCSDGKNVSCEGNPLRIGGETYKDGVGVHARSTLVYEIPAGAGRFVATVGLDDEKSSDERSSVVARIYGDTGQPDDQAVLLGESPVLSNATVRLWHFDIELSNRLRRIRLTIDDAGDGIASDHADWVNSGFVMD